jgi:hypothetical protein
MSLIDCKEGCPNHYQRVLVCVSDQEGQLLRDVVSYEVVPEQKRPEFCPPKREYVDLMRRAACRFGFSEEYRRTLEAVETLDCENCGR